MKSETPLEKHSAASRLVRMECPYCLLELRLLDTLQFSGKMYMQRFFSCVRCRRSFSLSFSYGKRFIIVSDTQLKKYLEPEEYLQELNKFKSELRKNGRSN